MDFSREICSKIDGIESSQFLAMCERKNSKQIQDNKYKLSHKIKLPTLHIPTPK